MTKKSKKEQFKDFERLFPVTKKGIGTFDQHKELKKKALKRPGVKAEYDRLSIGEISATDLLPGQRLDNLARLNCLAEDFPNTWKTWTDQILNPETSKQGKKALCSKALHPEFSDPLIEVAELSLEKGYKALNWLDKDSKVTVTYCLAAAKRHLQKAEMGIDLNSEELGIDGLPTKIQCQHLAQVAYNCLMALMILKERPEADDRLFKNGVRK